MEGCCRRAVIMASRTKRGCNPGDGSSISLTATMRFSRLSRTRSTRPMLPPVCSPRTTPPDATTDVSSGDACMAKGPRTRDSAVMSSAGRASSSGVVLLGRTIHAPRPLHQRPQDVNPHTAKVRKLHQLRLLHRGAVTHLTVGGIAHHHVPGH